MRNYKSPTAGNLSRFTGIRSSSFYDPALEQTELSPELLNDVECAWPTKIRTVPSSIWITQVNLSLDCGDLSKASAYRERLALKATDAYEVNMPPKKTAEPYIPLEVITDEVRAAVRAEVGRLLQWAVPIGILGILAVLFF